MLTGHSYLSSEVQDALESNYADLLLASVGPYPVCPLVL
jgi:hypothetical protein